MKEAKIVKANNNNNILKSQWRGLAGANTTNKHGHIMDKPYLMLLEQLETGRVNFYRQIWLVMDSLLFGKMKISMTLNASLMIMLLRDIQVEHKMNYSICVFVTKSGENNLKMYVVVCLVTCYLSLHKDIKHNTPFLFSLLIRSKDLCLFF